MKTSRSYQGKAKLLPGAPSRATLESVLSSTLIRLLLLVGLGCGISRLRKEVRGACPVVRTKWCRDMEEFH